MDTCILSAVIKTFKRKSPTNIRSEVLERDRGARMWVGLLFLSRQ